MPWFSCQVRPTGVFSSSKDLGLRFQAICRSRWSRHGVGRRVAPQPPTRRAHWASSAKNSLARFGPRRCPPGSSARKSFPCWTTLNLSGRAFLLRAQGGDTEYNARGSSGLERRASPRRPPTALAGPASPRAGSCRPELHRIVLVPHWNRSSTAKDRRQGNTPCPGLPCVAGA